MRVVAVTGANGFVGRSVVPFLDTMPDTRTRSIVRSSSVTGEDDSVSIVQDFLLDRAAIRNALEGVEVLVHLAGVISAPDECSEEESVEFFNVSNVHVTQSVVEAAIEAGVSRIVYLSSLSLYGMGSSARILSADSIVSPDTAYASSKYAGEERVRSMAEAAGIEWVSIRPPMVLGPGTSGTLHTMAAAFGRVGFSPLGLINNYYPVVQLSTLNKFVGVCVTLPDIPSGVYLVGERQKLRVPEILDSIAGRRLRHLPVPSRLVRSLLVAAGKGREADHLFSDLVLDVEPAHSLMDEADLGTA